MSERPLADEWEAQADAWARWTRTPGRPLASWFGLFVGAGFQLEDVREPRPAAADVVAVPRLAESRVKPAFLHVRWRR